MTQDTSTYYVWIGCSCDYGHKERAGGAAVVIEHNGNIISRDVISDLHTTDSNIKVGKSGLDCPMHRGKEKAQICRSQNRTISQKSIADRNP